MSVRMNIAQPVSAPSRAQRASRGMTGKDFAAELSGYGCAVLRETSVAGGVPRDRRALPA